MCPHPSGSSCVMCSAVSVFDMTYQPPLLLWSHLNYLSPIFLTHSCVISASVPPSEWHHAAPMLLPCRDTDLSSLTVTLTLFDAHLLPLT